MTTARPLRLLLVEDNVDDAELVLAELRRRGFLPQTRRVDSVSAVQEALATERWDVVLCDFNMPTCNGVDILEAVRRVDADLPFLFVSGSIGEDIAVAAMRAGAHDYILKDNLTRLAAAVTRELHDADERRAHRQTTAALRQTEARLRRVFDSSMVGLVFWKFDGSVMEANAEYLRLTGYSAEDVAQGRINWLTLVPAETKANAPAVRAELEAHGAAQPFEVELLTKTGTRRPVLVGSMLLDAEAGEGASFVMDMTQAVADREARIALADQLRQAQKMELVARLAGGVAHDFNNLLAVVLLSAGLARDEAPDGLQPLLDDITEAAQEGAALTRQLLALGRRQALVPDLISLNEVIESQQSLLRRLAGEPVALHLALSPDLRPTRADATQIEQVVLNLCVNARDAMPEGGDLTIHTENVELADEVHTQHGTIPPGRYVLLAVADTGIGMGPETMARIFEPFFSTKGEGRGTGLGLSVVHGIVAQSGGYVAVYSEPGMGTTFRVYLPQADGPQPRPPAAPDPVHSRASADQVILLAEDESTLRRAAVRSLQRCGYTVMSAASAQEAIAQAERYSGRIHLLVTDVVMPGMSGPELFTHLRRSRPDLRALFTSGYLPDQISRTSAPVLEGHFLPKPFTMADLAARVQDLLA